MAYPFFHLSSSPFWQLVKTPSYQGRTEYSSIKALGRDFSGAVIDEALFDLMKDPISREELKALLKATYLDDPGACSSVMGIATIIALIFAVA